MDVVYPIIQNEDNEELKYSLRSLEENFIFDKVFIIWHKPSWIQNVVHIEFDDSIVPFWSYNTSKKLLHICENNDISEDFVFMADDIYFLEKIENLWYYKKWDMCEYLEFLKSKWPLTQHWVVIERTMRQYSHLGNIGCFETHTPIIYNRSKMREILLEYNLGDIAKRSVYCIENNITWEDLITYNYLWSEILNDCKYYNNWSLMIKKWQQFLSSMNFESEEIKKFLQRKFNKPSRFEIIF